MPESSTLTEDRLSPKEQSFLDRIKAQTANLTTRLQENLSLQFIYNIAFRFEVPKDFTQQEFNRVGRELTALSWQWEEIRRGQYGWSFILLPI